MNDLLTELLTPGCYNESAVFVTPFSVEVCADFLVLLSLLLLSVTTFKLC